MDKLIIFMQAVCPYEECQTPPMIFTHYMETNECRAAMAYENRGPGFGELWLDAPEGFYFVKHAWCEDK